jgi:FkbM family methyltransferase
VLGDSRDILPQLDLSEPTVFWLDGHWSAGDTAGEGDECPLLDELATIGPQHAILIDDARLFIEPPPPPHDPEQWPTLEQVIDALDDREVAIRDDVVIALPRRRRSRWLLGLWRLGGRVAQIGPKVAVMSTPLLRSVINRLSRRAGRPSEAPHHERLLSKPEIHKLVGRDDPLILEIGCNDGGDSLGFLAEFPSCRLHCFECDPRPIQSFRSNVSDDRVQLHEVALSDHTGVATLHMSGGTDNRFREDWDLSSSLLEPTGHLTAVPFVTFERTCQVETVRLDDWADRVIPDGVVDFIWMDVQGAEHLVIAGGASTFARTRFCYFEYSDSELYKGQQDLQALLRALGTYRLLATYENNALAVNTGLW